MAGRIVVTAVRLLDNYFPNNVVDIIVDYIDIYLFVELLDKISIFHNDCLITTEEKIVKSIKLILDELDNNCKIQWIRVQLAHFLFQYIAQVRSQMFDLEIFGKFWLSIENKLYEFHITEYNQWKNYGSADPDQWVPIAYKYLFNIDVNSRIKRFTRDEIIKQVNLSICIKQEIPYQLSLIKFPCL